MALQAHQCRHEPVLPQGRLQVPQAEPAALEEQALLHQGVGLLPGRGVPAREQQEHDSVQRPAACWGEIAIVGENMYLEVGYFGQMRSYTYSNHKFTTLAS